MTHPEELLAGYVDGALPARDRAAVDAHLAGCARCRGEVSLAVSARSALRSLPEVPAPAGIATRALEESRGAGSAVPGGGTPRWYRVAGIAAAAAAGLLIVTLTLPHIGQSDDAGNAVRATAGETSDNGNDPRELAASVIEIEHTNYDQESLTALSRSYALASDAGGGAEASPPSSLQAASIPGSQKQTDDALACVRTSAPDATGTLRRLIKARFQGHPAYIAVFLDGPGAGQPDDAVSVWVFATSDCSILSSSFAKL
jgi:hypothetical protein